MINFQAVGEFRIWGAIDKTAKLSHGEKVMHQMNESNPLFVNPIMMVIFQTNLPDFYI